MKIVNLPDNVVKHENDVRTAYTIPVDGFDKLIAYKTQKGSWVHKAYRPEPSKKTKKGKKKA